MQFDISAVIIEDNPESSLYLKSILKDNNVQIIGTSDNVKDSINLLNTTAPELVLMDIELLDGNAFQVLDRVQNQNFEVIFITAHSNYLQRALDYYAFHFITKPLDSFQLLSILDRYENLKRRLFTQQRYKVFKEFIFYSHLLINVGHKHLTVDLKNVIICQAEGNYTYFHTNTNESLLASKSLKYYEKLLSEKGFFRANRFSLINTAHIAYISRKETIVLSDKKRINVSVRNKPKLAHLIRSLS